MKILMYLPGILFLAGVLLMAGCQKDETPEPVGDPTIALVSGEDYISGDATLAAGEKFTVKISAAMNVNTNKKLVTLEVYRNFTPVTKGTAVDTTFYFNLGMEEELIIDLDVTAYPAIGSELFEFTVIDEAGNKDKISLTITTEENVMAYADVLLGSVNDLEGSFMATSSGMTYIKAEAFQNQALIDLVFYLGATNGSTFAGPGDTLVQQVFHLNDDPDKWTTFNDTRFINPAPIGHAEFDAIGGAYMFPDFDGDASKSEAKQLQDNDVIFFETVDGKRGFIRINSISSRGDQVNFDVKVEK
jgi:hypothetical protein